MHGAGNFDEAKKDFFGPGRKALKIAEITRETDRIGKKEKIGCQKTARRASIFSTLDN